MKIFETVEGQRTFYETRTIPLQSGDDYSQYQLIRSINYARRSRYIDSGAHDDIIGDFPYDNISEYRIRLEARSTDRDIKHMEVEPVDSSDEARVSSMVSTKALQKKMRDMRFGKTLNEYAVSRARYGAVLFKRVETEDGKDVYIVPWENVITDMTDILSSPVVEKHFYTPGQLKKQVTWNNVDEAIKTAKEKKKSKDIGGKTNADADTFGSYITVYEVTGEVERALLLEAQGKEWKEEDMNEFVLARIIYAPFGKDKSGKHTGIIFRADEITEDEYPYKLDVRHPVIGRAFGEGLPEELAEHQRWHNFYKTEEARAVAIGGKILFYTDDGNVVDSIYSDGIDHGTILQVGEGKTFKQLNTVPSSVPVYQNITEAWDTSADKKSNSFEAVMGEESKSGTPFRAQYLQNVAGTSQFEQELEDMGLFLEELIGDWILEDALNEAAEADEIDEVFTKEELDLIDRTIINKEMGKRGAESLLNGQLVTPEIQAVMEKDITTDLKRKGARRKITGIQKFIRNAGKKVIVRTTDEQRSKAVLFESYSNAINLAKGIDRTDPVQLALRDKVLDMIGVSEQELMLYVNQAMQAAEQMAPQGGQVKMQTGEMNKEQSVAPVM
ncbi:MAG: hypothetical protein IPO40_24365 [Fibrobacteres bacterium]|nr:hypothetical protein [Fibrobacterota bacterium]